MSGIITLLIAAAITWYVACGLMPWEYIGWDATLAPLYDSARMTGSPTLIVILFIGTLLSAIASSNGCTNDQARACLPWGAIVICRNGSQPYIRNIERHTAPSCS